MRRLTARAVRALAAGLLVLGVAGAPGEAAGLKAGAASVEVTLPPDTPLGGYGGFPRRAWLPDVLGRHPHAFWFRPSTGIHDPVRVRGLVLESATTRVLWLAVDLVGTDPSLMDELRERLRRHGTIYSAVIVSASHTHSGPGAYANSALFGFLAMDRQSPAVRGPILDGLERAAREAESRKAPATIGTGRTEVTGIAQSRLHAPLDPELGVVKVASTDGRPLALVWNYAIHGTALGRENSLLSGDLMADAGARIERELGVPALFVNGAVGDVSPQYRGWPGVNTAGRALSAAALRAWRQTATDAKPQLEVATGRIELGSPALALGNCLGGRVPAGVALGLRRALPSSAEVIALSIGTSGWVTIPGELQTKLGLEIKAAARPLFRHVFVAGVSNDYLGYFLAPADYGRPSYIACGSLYGERGGELMRDAAIAALRRLGGGRAAR